VRRAAELRAEAYRAIAEGFLRLAKAEELDGRERGAGEDEYSSDALPKGMTRRRFAAKCRALAQARTPGVRRAGRTWIAPRTVIEQRAPIARGGASRSDVPAASDAPWSAAAAVAEALRGKGGS
jgi:hypothetical protein